MNVIVRGDATVLLSYGVIIAYYMLTAPLQPRYFSLSRTQAHCWLVLPLYGLLTAWGVSLVWADRMALFLSIVAPFSLIFITAIWPVLRHNEQRRQRRIPYPVAYALSAGFVVVVSFVNVGGIS